MAGVWRASDPLAEYARRMHYTTECASCGAWFDPDRDASTKLCPDCGSGAGRARRHRASGVSKVSAEPTAIDATASAPVGQNAGHNGLHDTPRH